MTALLERILCFRAGRTIRVSCVGYSRISRLPVPINTLILIDRFIVRHINHSLNPHITIHINAVPVSVRRRNSGRDRTTGLCPPPERFFQIVRSPLLSGTPCKFRPRVSYTPQRVLGCFGSHWLISGKLRYSIIVRLAFFKPSIFKSNKSPLSSTAIPIFPASVSPASSSSIRSFLLPLLD
jgi:hypothetical protein